MNCKKCGNLNKEGAKFCIKCGNKLEVNEINSNEGVQSVERPVNQMTDQQTIIKEPILSQQPMQQSVVQPIQQAVDNGMLNYPMFIVNVLLKPYKTFKEEENKLCNVKTSLIFSSIIVVAMMLINLITSMISAIFINDFDVTKFEYVKRLELSNLGKLDYLELIGKNLLIYAGIIAGIALIYYIVSLLFKKNTNYIKLLSITAISAIPTVLITMVVAPILGIIWETLYFVVSIIGIIYSIVIFITLISENIKFENKDLNMYFHLICISVIGVSGYYLLMNILTSSISSDFGSILDMFG